MTGDLGRRRKMRRWAEDAAAVASLMSADGSAEARWNRFDRLRERHVPPASHPSDVYRVPAAVHEDDDDGGNVFETGLSPGGGGGGGDEREYFDLRHITSINALLVDGIPRQVYIDAAGASLLALHHFNHGMDDAVPEIRNVTERCRTRFTMDLVDTMHSPIEACRAFLKDVLLRRKRGGGDLPGGDEDDERVGNDDNHNNATLHLPVPTAIYGASRSAVSMPLALISGIHGVPMISHISTSTELDNRDQYPLFGRLLPPALADATFAVDYLSRVLDVGHFGILYVKDSYGSTYAQGLEHAAARASPVPLMVQSASIPESSPSPEARRDTVAEAIGQLKRSGLRYFFGVYYPGDYDLVMEEAYRQGIAGPGYFWIYSDSMLGLQGQTFDSSSQSGLIDASRGSALIVPAASEVLRGKRGYEAFLRDWRELREPESEARRFFDSKVKAQFMKADGGDKLLRDFQFSENPHSWALLSYDSVMATLFSICDAASTADSTARSSEFKEHNTVPAELSGEDVFASFLNISFKGIYGEEVSIDHATGSRKAETVPFSILNLLPSPPKNGLIAIDFFATHVRDAGTNGEVGSKAREDGSSWRSLGRTFVFADGTSEAPPDLPPMEHNSNSITPGARAAGFTMCAVVVLTSVILSLWTFWHRECRVIKQAQPIFLYIVVAGTLITGSAIIPLGVDELGPSGHDSACQAAPWLVVVGFSLTFSALYAKEERIRMLMKRDMRRIKVTARHVMKHTVIVVALNVLILTVWTVTAPFTYQRTDVETSMDVYGRSTESYGVCALPSDPNDPDRTHWVGIFFVSLIAIVNGCFLVVALYRVYLTRRIKTEFSESRYIGLSMVSISQAWLVGIPLMLVGRRLPNGLYIVLSVIIFIMCQSILLLIFVPKMYFLRDWKKKRRWIEQERVRKSRKQSWMQASSSERIHAATSERERAPKNNDDNWEDDCGVVSVQCVNEAEDAPGARSDNIASTEERRHLQLISEVQDAIEDGQVVTSAQRKMVSFLQTNSAAASVEDKR